ncbi:ABC transporter permease [Vallitalea maricola]|uniref:FtsX-like permease family protein n=1 Tax=Vallitalea maricola TaxID=3074433 RepID=A0ACB5UP96_9FIRM|nr:FtsX-like permease family protein [Vallitalea sp. AN17-2]
MGIEYVIAKSNLKVNRQKSLLSIIAIMLTTVLFTSVGIICIKNYVEQKNMIEHLYGKNHGRISELRREDIDFIQKQAQLGEYAFVGKSIVDKNYISIEYKDPMLQKLNLIDIDLIEGKVPEAENEIMLDKEAIELLGYSPKIGEHIKLDYIIEDKHCETEFILVGITQARENFKLKGIYFAGVSLTFLENHVKKEDLRFTAYIRFNEKLSITEINAKFSQIIENINVDKKYLRVNEFYLNTKVVEPSSALFVIVIILIIFTCAFLIIYNIFNISVIHNIKAYGKIIAIGGNKRQMKKIVFFEGSILSAIAIPIGVAIAYVINFIIINRLISKNPIEFSGYYLMVILMSVAISYITVFISILKPMKIASRISPIEAIRHNGKYKTKKRKKYYKQLTVFRLMLINIFSHKKRTVLTLMSMCFSSILILIASAFMNSVKPEDIAYKSVGADFIIKLHNYTEEESKTVIKLNQLQLNNPLDKSLIQHIQSIDGIKNVKIQKKVRAKLGEDSLFDSVSCIPQEEFDHLLGKAPVHDKNILLIGEDANVFYSFSDGQVLNVVIYDGNRKLEEQFIVHIIEENGLFVSEDIMSKLIETNINFNISMNIDRKKYEDINRELRSLVDKNDNLYIISYFDTLEVVKKALHTKSVLMYGLAIVVTIIGFINYINTMSASILARKKEIGILQAVGLSNRQLNNLVELESLFYIIITIFTGLTIGNVSGYIICNKANDLMGGLTYSYPYIQSCLFVALMLIGHIVVMKIIKINLFKDSLVNRIRFSE